MSHFLQACRGEATEVTPLWLMRQAGRYLPEYREIRQKMSMLEALQSPATACEITLQPLRRFPLDAAIVFFDILMPLVGMGLKLDFVKGEGPQLSNPLHTTKDIDRLGVPPTAESMPYVLETIRLLVPELKGTPLIGFAGAPFTLASYAIEGGGSRDYARTKAMMYHEPAAWKRLMDKLVIAITDLLEQQLKAGASAVQIFDSWAGALSPRDYQKFVAPYNKTIIENVKKHSAPVIYFSTGTTGLLDSISALGADVVGVDWRVTLSEARHKLGGAVPLQGNLDPMVLASNWREIQAHVDTILQQARDMGGKHIFNLGHGVLPHTPIDNVARLVDYVHAHGGNRS